MDYHIFRKPKKLKNKTVHRWYYYFYDPSFFKDTYSSYNVRTAVENAVEAVVLSGVSPEQAIQEAVNSLK